MDRIGAIKEAMRLESRPVVASAPIRFSLGLRVVVFFLLFGILGFSVGKAQANFAISDKCFATAPEALDAFNSRYPFFDIAKLEWWSVGASSITGQNINVILRRQGVNQPLITTAISNCTEITNEPFDTALGGAFWAFGFAGVMILYFSSHVIGLVLKSVRHG